MNALDFNLIPIGNWAALTSAWDAWAFTLALTLLFPPLGVYLNRRFVLHPAGSTGGKQALYAAVIGVEWLLVGMLFGLSRRHALSIAALGLRRGDIHKAEWIGALLLAMVVILARQNVRQLQKMKAPELEKALGRALPFYPRGGTEMLLFVLLALTTGLCEELLYRGWLMPFAGALCGSLWLGLVIAAVAFGIGHWHQGRRGMIATGILGLIFGSMYLFSSTLYVSQIVHSAINLVNGLLGAYAISLLGRTSRTP